jgi:hypothetical protein
MRHFYEAYHQRRLRSRIGNYTSQHHHTHNHHHSHHHHTHHYSSVYLLHHLPQPQTTLCCLVQNQAWPEVVRRSTTHPREVLFQDAVTGNTVSGYSTCVIFFQFFLFKTRNSRFSCMYKLLF